MSESRRCRHDCERHHFVGNLDGCMAARAKVESAGTAMLVAAAAAVWFGVFWGAIVRKIPMYDKMSCSLGQFGQSGSHHVDR